jgi:hypothetical protein
MNHKLSELTGNADTVRIITRRIAWIGHVMRMNEREYLKEY